MSHARLNTLLFFIFLIISPDPYFLIAATVGKPDFRGISMFLILILIENPVSKH